MTGHPVAQRLARHVIRRACGWLPDGIRDERYREWAAELPAILADPDVRSAAVRGARAVRYAAGVYRGARRLGRAAGRARGPADGWANRSRRRPMGRLQLPPGVIGGLSAVFIWIGDVVMIRAFPPHGGPDYPAIAVSIAAGVLGVVAAARFIRWLSRESPRR